MEVRYAPLLLPRTIAHFTTTGYVAHDGDGHNSFEDI